ncbi:PAS domain-containing protein [Fictibacillus sp. KU28468]|uniref:PAS domain-containing protein n=1 Tax=Fictibacillus sp. KU28468 TaxID=2991053 RepID=UPI00223D8C61|nr:PAS domain-containing protein [Fictibacillus sp. KU28468]UZJ78005.1 PAS domain-containing protein [Fictibacillus sp. KU28468]
MSGYTHEEVIGKNCRFLQGDETDRSKVKAIKDAISKKKRISVKLKNYRKDHTSFWNELTIDPFYIEDEAKYYFIGI